MLITFSKCRWGRKCGCEVTK